LSFTVFASLTQYHLLGKQDIKPTIEYNQLCDCFYCQAPDDTEEVGMEDIQVFLKRGYREIDLRLYNAAERFSFSETKELLDLGANPDITFYETEEDEKRDDGYNILDRIWSECSFLGSCEVLPEFKSYEERRFFPYMNQKNIENLLGDLIGLAAHEEMYDLLIIYSKDKK